MPSRAGRLWRGLWVAVAGAGIGVGILAPLAAAAAPLTVQVGHQLVTAVSGFAPGAAVARRVDNVPLAGTVRADRSGIVRVRLPAPAKTGHHRLVLIGAAPSSPGARAGATQPGDVPGADRQAIVVVVPRVAAVDFRVTPGLGTDGASARPIYDGGALGSGAGAGTAADSGSTADTGVNSLRSVLAGAALVVVGGVLTALGRKRRVSLVAGGSARGRSA